jgi:hypothetical protein
MGDYAQPVDRPPPRHGTGLMSLDGLRTILATLGAIWGNRTYGSRLRLLVDYLRIGVAYAREMENH